MHVTYKPTQPLHRFVRHVQLENYRLEIVVKACMVARDQVTGLSQQQGASAAEQHLLGCQQRCVRFQPIKALGPKIVLGKLAAHKSVIAASIQYSYIFLRHVQLT